MRKRAGIPSTGLVQLIVFALQEICLDAAGVRPEDLPLFLGIPERVQQVRVLFACLAILGFMGQAGCVSEMFLLEMFAHYVDSQVGVIFLWSDFCK